MIIEILVFFYEVTYQWVLEGYHYLRWGSYFTITGALLSILRESMGNIARGATHAELYMKTPQSVRDGENWT